ncbi:hypothetical protein D3C73_1049960 [compost metagenome]
MPDILIRNFICLFDAVELGVDLDAEVHLIAANWPVDLRANRHIQNVFFAFVSVFFQPLRFQGFGLLATFGCILTSHVAIVPTVLLAQGVHEVVEVNAGWEFIEWDFQMCSQL